MYEQVVINCWDEKKIFGCLLDGLFFNCCFFWIFFRDFKYEGFMFQEEVIVQGYLFQLSVVRYKLDSWVLIFCYYVCIVLQLEFI